MKDAWKSFKNKIKASSGFLTAKGQIVNRKEVHAFGIGVYHGVTPHMTIPNVVLEDNEDVRREPHYAKGGFVAGTLVQWAGIVAVGGKVIA